MGADWLVAGAWRLWRWATAGLLLAAAGAAAAGAAWAGRSGALAVAAGAGAAYLFFGLGHAAQVASARFDARLLLVAALATYGLQVAVATIVVSALTAAGWPGGWVFGGVAAGVAGWVGGLVAGYRQARVPVFDPPSETAL